MVKSLNNLLQMIKNGEIKLPDLQRDFVWREDQIRELLDSLMREYPFGYFLFWNTQFIEIHYRDFIDNYKDGITFATKLKPINQRTLMVLDGQQRLQSLYIAIFGSYNGRCLYFDITSNPIFTSEDEGDKNYKFEFRQDSDAKKPKKLLKVADILLWPSRQEEQEIEKALKKAEIDDEHKLVVARNLRQIRRIFTNESTPVIIIDDSAIEKEQTRSIREVLEIFVRINSGGTRLTHSDLMFSLIKTKWTNARSQFDSFVEELKSFGFDIDNDFLIRCLLTMSDAPTHFDVDIIEKHWDDMQPNFDLMCDALRSVLDFSRTSELRLYSASLLQPLSSIIPIMYYLKRFQNCSIPDNERKSIRTFIYFLLYNGFLRGKNPAARIRYLREVFQNSPNEFPLKDLLNQISTRQTYSKIIVDDEILNWNIHLTLSIALPKAAQDTLSWQEKPEVDHIFPQSKYREIFPDKIDDIGNFAYLGKLRNIRKRAEEPYEYFSNLTDEELKNDFLIEDRNLLKSEFFEEFIKSRRQRILEVVKSYIE